MNVMRMVVFAVLVAALPVQAVAACFGDSAPVTMKCCTALRGHECHTMPSMACCTADGAGRQSQAGPIESAAAAAIESRDAFVPGWMDAARIALSVPIGSAPGPLLPPHLINSVLL